MTHVPRIPAAIFHLCTLHLSPSLLSSRSGSERTSPPPPFNTTLSTPSAAKRCRISAGDFVCVLLLQQIFRRPCLLVCLRVPPLEAPVHMPLLTFDDSFLSFRPSVCLLWRLFYLRYGAIWLFLAVYLTPEAPLLNVLCLMWSSEVDFYNRALIQMSYNILNRPPSILNNHANAKVQTLFSFHFR